MSRDLIILYSFFWYILKDVIQSLLLIYQALETLGTSIYHVAIYPPPNFTPITKVMIRMNTSELSLSFHLGAGNDLLLITNKNLIKSWLWLVILNLESIITDPQSNRVNKLPIHGPSSIIVAGHYKLFSLPGPLFPTELLNMYLSSMHKEKSSPLFKKMNF